MDIHAQAPVGTMSQVAATDLFDLVGHGHDFAQAKIADNAQKRIVRGHWISFLFEGLCGFPSVVGRKDNDNRGELFFIVLNRKKDMMEAYCLLARPTRPIHPRMIHPDVAWPRKRGTAVLPPRRGWQ